MKAKDRAHIAWGMTRQSTFRVVEGKGRMRCFSEEELASAPAYDIRMLRVLSEAAVLPRKDNGGAGKAMSAARAFDIDAIMRNVRAAAKCCNPATPATLLQNAPNRSKGNG